MLISKQTSEAENTMISTLLKGPEAIGAYPGKTINSLRVNLGLIFSLLIAYCVLFSMPAQANANVIEEDPYDIHSDIEFQEVETVDQISRSEATRISVQLSNPRESNLIQKAEYIHSGNLMEDSTDSKTLAAGEKAEEPSSFRLKQNYPNPFNPATEISYRLPANRHVVLKVYDMLGRPVKTLVNKNQEAGNYTVRFNAGGLTSGMYLYRLKAGDYEQIRKMILIK